jgi:hypothetical protein
MLKFEALAAVAVNGSVFGDITPCSPSKVNRRFGETCLRLQQISACCLLNAGFILGLVLNPEDGCNVFAEKLVDFQRTTRHYVPEDITLQFNKNVAKSTFREKCKIRMSLN